ncbi:MAG: D-alanyl-D-alanine carboxypeptidase [Rhodospirillaceae bacterium]|nr:D-alanyl-D-alanine carboxypeptidase [Rhodospirillaceae bacterium]
MISLRARCLYMYKKLFLFLVLIKLNLVISSYSYANNQIETLAKYAIVLDYQTNKILLNKNSEELMFPASMSKLMTAYVVFSHLSSNKISLEDTFRVSEKAWKKGGSKMFVEIGKRVSVEDLLRGMIIQSGNDASIVLAEGLFGSEELFSMEMNRFARTLGMNNTNFRNSTGWPDPEHVTTAKDLSLLAISLYKNFPEFMKYYSEKNFTYNDIKQGNRNPLLYKNLGSDGLKTGHTEESGYGLVGSALRNGRRVIIVVNGLKSSKDRSNEAERLIDWSFREFKNYELFDKNDIVFDIPVWLGNKETVPLVLNKKLLLTLNNKQYRNLKLKINYKGPIKAPIKKDTKLATLKIYLDKGEVIEKPLYSNVSIEQLTFIGKLKTKLEYLLFGESIIN